MEGRLEMWKLDIREMVLHRAKKYFVRAGNMFGEVCNLSTKTSIGEENWEFHHMHNESGDREKLRY